MKQKQIRRVEDLPAEFSLQKYSATSTFDIVDWVVNLEERSYCMFLLGAGRISPRISAKHPDVARAIRAEAPQATLILLDNPISGRMKFKETGGMSKNIHTSHVSDMTVNDYFIGGDVRNDNRFSKYTDAYNHYESVGNDALAAPIHDPVWKMYKNSDIDDEANVYVQVDLHGSEDKIIEDFAKWLRATRAALQIEAPKKRIAKQDFIEWTTYAVLPYLDLTMWATAHGAEITHQVLGNAIFPDEINVNLPERIRKVVRPLARKVSREIFTDALRSQARAEMVESNSDKLVPAKFCGYHIPD